MEERLRSRHCKAAHYLHLIIVPTFLSHPQPLHTSRPCFPHHTAWFCPEPMLLPCSSVPLPALLSKRSALLWCHPHTALSVYPVLPGTLPLCAKLELLRTTAVKFLQVSAGPETRGATAFHRVTHCPACYQLPPAQLSLGMDRNFSPVPKQPFKIEPGGKAQSRGSFGSAFVSFLLGRHALSKNRHQRVYLGKHPSRQAQGSGHPKDRLQAAEPSDQQLHCQREPLSDTV